LTGKEEQNVLDQATNLTAAQIADRILVTDRAVHLDSKGYSDRRSFMTVERAETLPAIAGGSADSQLRTRSTRS
jgi:hypothetical protein